MSKEFFIIDPMISKMKIVFQNEMTPRVSNLKSENSQRVHITIGDYDNLVYLNKQLEEMIEVLKYD